MPTLVERPTVIEAAGKPPKRIEEFIGRVNTGTHGVSIAHMRSPAGWREPGQRPEFTEYTLVLHGTLYVEHDAGTLIVGAGQAVVSQPGEWVRYHTPDGAEYIAVVIPAFSPETVHRDPE
jgi:hypothetical protein